jgi:hypothetical protein
MKLFRGGKSILDTVMIRLENLSITSSTGSTTRKQISGAVRTAKTTLIFHPSVGVFCIINCDIERGKEKVKHKYCNGERRRQETNAGGTTTECRQFISIAEPECFVVPRAMQFIVGHYALLRGSFLCSIMISRSDHQSAMSTITINKFLIIYEANFCAAVDVNGTRRKGCICCL